MMDTYIDDFNTSFYIPKIQKIEFNFTHIQNLGTDNCGKSRCEES